MKTPWKMLMLLFVITALSSCRPDDEYDYEDYDEPENASVQLAINDASSLT